MDIKAFQDADLCKKLLGRLCMAVERCQKERSQPVRFMEVCGTHTVAIFQSGLRSLLPPGLLHISGPGCPVCVTHDSEVAGFLELAASPHVIIATFGDLLRVPGPDGRSLKHAMAEGANVHVVYSPLDTLTLAEKNPQKEVVFLGVGFETTAPTVAGMVLEAKRRGLGNVSVLACHKLVPPALRALMDNDSDGFSCDIDAFLLPGHVATILGLQPFAFVAKNYGIPAAVGGFEPADILSALVMMTERVASGQPGIDNAYQRAVAESGNPKARQIMFTVFQECDARWRGLGVIPRSGLAFQPAFAAYDALAKLDIQLPMVEKKSPCRCGHVLTGKINPSQCPLFGTACTPQNPVGPCMVSTEGSCAAWYQYA